MGDPRRLRKKYKGPGHPWQRVRIEEERVVKREYGLKNKQEIWKASSELKRVNEQVKRFIREKAKGNKQAFTEEKQLLDKLYKFNLIEKDAKLEEVLNLEFRDFLDRRLQTIVFKSGLSLTSSQARQFIVHGHILVNGRRISIPSYLVSREEQFNITFDPTSSIASEEHSERVKKISVDKASARKAEVDKKKGSKEEGELTEEQLELIDKKVGGDIVEV